MEFAMGIVYDSQGHHKKGIKSMIIMGDWELWQERTTALSEWLSRLSPA